MHREDFLRRHKNTLSLFKALAAKSNKKPSLFGRVPSSYLKNSTAQLGSPTITVKPKTLLFNFLHFDNFFQNIVFHSSLNSVFGILFCSLPNKNIM